MQKQLGIDLQLGSKHYYLGFGFLLKSALSVFRFIYVIPSCYHFIYLLLINCAVAWMSAANSRDREIKIITPDQSGLVNVDDRQKRNVS